MWSTHTGKKVKIHWLQTFIENKNWNNIKNQYCGHARKNKNKLGQAKFQSLTALGYFVKMWLLIFKAQYFLYVILVLYNCFAVLFDLYLQIKLAPVESIFWFALIVLNRKGTQFLCDFFLATPLQ